MDKTRTIYRLRKNKNNILINVIVLLFGILLLSLLQIFELNFLNLFRDKNLALLNNDYNFGINKALWLSEISYKILEKSAILSIVFSLEGFIMLFFIIRLNGRSKGILSNSPFILGLGTLIVFTYYFLMGVLSPGKGNLNEISQNFFILRVLGFILILIANIMFVIKMFIDIILERDKE
ncbi:MAG TPA: hypothetical protein P5538_09950 [Bacteroidales bacterium]|jgi:hypothetical protein|nr:hypothetical protein [Bacteroidales bacterium]HOL99052.1 hypothetical protein [Bacteroidales bacterium]HOM37443.1 hypothetical protein [Bacteroidales bacterium]HPD24913.1 hypothetical protein [Bacteroidales bacterium]HRT00622.1 hypothetical protein [Bacteroidales bacterium]